MATKAIAICTPVLGTLDISAAKSDETLPLFCDRYCKSETILFSRFCIVNSSVFLLI